MPSQNFKSLYVEEQSSLGLSLASDQVKVSPPGPAGEPRVTQTPAESVGLALSGGGIRSATFNLGLMQGLDELEVLGHVDYLATVSGGGYIGSWWSAWRRRTQSGTLFPRPTESHENSAVRHLREFSNFVAPRLGFFQSETWNCVMASLGALLPALLATLSVVVLALILWVGLALASLRMNSAWVVFGLALLVGLAAEIRWWKRRESENSERDAGWFVFAVALAMMCVGLVRGWWPALLAKWAGWSNAVYMPVAGWQPLPLVTSDAWWRSVGIPSAPELWLINPQLFAPAIIWLGAALGLMLLRVIILWCWSFFEKPVDDPGRCCTPNRRLFVNATDRAGQRLIALAVIWAVLGSLWLLGCYWHQLSTWLAGGTVATGGVFALLRRWIGEDLIRKKKKELSEKLKPLLPQVVACATLVLTVVLTAGLLTQWFGRNPAAWWGGFFAALGIVVLALLVFNPTEISLHALYRSRIVRAYLGASNPDALAAGGAANPQPRVVEDNRQTDVRDRDDMLLSDLEGQRPLHLICCAANDVSGDPLATLARGSRSAVLSGFGFAMGNYSRMDTGLSLGSAVTASAAAFNSNMGSVSMRLGAAVTFLMTALNLRLGLWVPSPMAEKSWWRRNTPGVFFFKELFGSTCAGFRSCGDDNHPAELMAPHVHLSDGAHFENLALYELVRRHCRYIIVSDCGADPTVAFDDFGNAVRRIREDFGVEIEIDLDPLKPGEGKLSRQHVAVGTIHYDGTGGLDKGILLYFKPTLTGDEPGDVTQYKTRNPVFPHETTGDQLYDEAQWESYRRLGQHSAHVALRFLERRPQRGLGCKAHNIFTEAHWEWYPLPPDIGQNFTDLTSRCVALESELRNARLPVLTRQVFPELDVIAPQTASPMSPALTKSEEMETSLRFLLQATQLMEDVWFVAHLDTHWNHPINVGWMNYFQRWACAPLFRLWWPLLSPQFNLRFRRFMEGQCDLPRSFGFITDNNLRRRSQGGDFDKGLAWQVAQRTCSVDSKATEIYGLEVSLKDDTPGQPTRHSLQLAVLGVQIKDREAHWHGDDVFILPGLWNSGFGTPFIRLILDDLGTRGLTECCVMLSPREKDEPKLRTDTGSRHELADHIEFYRNLGFSQREGRLVQKLPVSA